MQPQTVKIARRLVRPILCLEMRHSGAASLLAVAPGDGLGEGGKGAGEDAEFVSALFAFAVGLSQNCMALRCSALSY